MDKREQIESLQQQATAGWIDYLNQLRLNELTDSLRIQDVNLKDATEHLDWAVKTIKNDIIKTNRGGNTGIHGFISEVAEVGIGNARSRITGGKAGYSWINDNSLSDIKKFGEEIQMKFYESDLSLTAITEHLEKYPDYIKNGGKYIIPKNQYDKIKTYLSMSDEYANKFLTKNGEYRLSEYQKVKRAFSDGKIGFNDIEPSLLDYSEVQRDRINRTINKERKSIKETDQEIRDTAYESSKPTLSEGAKATAVSIVAEGGLTFAFELAEKIKQKKSIRNLNGDDWEEIAKNTGVAAVRGGVRGASIYALSNYTATPAYAASEAVNASINVGNIVNQFRKGEISEAEMIEKSEIACLDACVSSLCSVVGAFIPVPVVGSLLVNMVGMHLYNNAKQCFTEYETRVFEGYLSSIAALDRELDGEYKMYSDALSKEMAEYMILLENAFSNDIYGALTGSARLAVSMGVSPDEVLDSKEKTDSYFLG